MREIRSLRDLEIQMRRDDRMRLEAWLNTRFFLGTLLCMGLFWGSWASYAGLEARLSGRVARQVERMEEMAQTIKQYSDQNNRHLSEFLAYKYGREFYEWSQPSQQ